MCSVLEFSSESDKLRTLFSESNHFDSVLFIFDGAWWGNSVGYRLFQENCILGGYRYEQ